jgi:nitrogen fixation protein NifU and related proteins
MAQLYHKIILQHYRQPLNFGRLQQPTKTLRGVNYYCGDELTFYVKLNQQGVITDIAWQGKGCAISQAAASIFSELVRDKNFSQVKKMSSQQLLKKLKLELSPTRIKCAVLPLYVLKEKALTFSGE